MDPYDEVQISANDTIIRRINPVQHIVWDENLGRFRISSKAFSPSSEPNGGMSIDVEELMLSKGVNPQEYVTTPVYTGAVAFPAGAARALGLLVGYDPIPENPYHGEVWGQNPPNRFSRAQKRGLGAASRWYVELSGISVL